MIYTAEYIIELFESDDVSSPALMRMIEISGLHKSKVAEGVNIKPDYLGKILRGERIATDMRVKIKEFLRKVSMASNNLNLAA